MSKLNIIYITSGSGNALFQLAFAEYIARNKKERVIVKDFLSFPNIFTKVFLNWNFHKESCIDYSKIKKNFDFLDIVALTIIFLISKKNRTFFVTNYFSISIFNRTYYHGYYQGIKSNLSSKLIKETCQKYISFSDDLSMQNIKTGLSRNCLIIHLRHGDFNKEIRLNEEFYKKAFLELTKNQKKEFSEVRIIGVSSRRFSEDLIEKLSLINGGKTKFINLINQTNIKEDFLTIWNSEHLISSNSTFAFWGSWGKNKIIVAPSSVSKMYLSVEDLSSYHKVIFL